MHAKEGREQPPLVTIEHVSKSFGAVRAVDDVSLTIREGEFFALLGPSGWQDKPDANDRRLWRT